MFYGDGDKFLVTCADRMPPMLASSAASVERVVGRCVSRRREIQAAYVFGSTITGRTRPDSDVDVAVLLDRRVRPTGMLSYRLGLMADLGSALRRVDVDVVILNEASPLLAHRVLSQGHCVFERSASARVQFHVRTAARYSDLLPMFRTHLQYLKKSVRRSRVVG